MLSYSMHGFRKAQPCLYCISSLVSEVQLGFSKGLSMKHGAFFSNRSSRETVFSIIFTTVSDCNQATTRLRRVIPVWSSKTTSEHTPGVAVKKIAYAALHTSPCDRCYGWPLTRARAARVLRQAFYVDDLLWSTDALDDACTLQNELVALRERGGLELRKWASNYPELVTGELADFEEMPNGPKITVTVLERDGFDSDPPAFKCKVAELQNSAAVVSEKQQIVGYALYFPTYSTWEGRTMMLEDLYVSPAGRKKGIGAKLFDSVAQEAVGEGCSRLDFHVLEWNDARAFYERRGAINLTATERWCYYRLTGQALIDIASATSVH
ncbi:hypothetical protein EVAR_36931_1 [Eumeta japonica]|uniref:N-acetyltransferase domain-containing protein n=1 Tax=Eumeta variegata TaxID=151549 RepID=A0A4C1X7X6_EUMVA|nr:hypothetical protein EVAR_36931_1 [Eumeta japonica]